MKTVLVTMAVVAALVAGGGVMPAETHVGSGGYYNVVVDVLEYERTPYSGFDLIQMKIAVENLADFNMVSPGFWIGGIPDKDDPWVNYGTVAYADVRARGGDVSVHDCSAHDMWSSIMSGGSGEALLCFMVGKTFQPDGLSIYHTSHWGSADGDRCGWPRDMHPKPWPDEYWNRETGTLWHDPPCSYETEQVIPFHDESTWCDYKYEFCNVDNIQPISDNYTPKPAPVEPPVQPAHVALLYAIYSNHTGTLTLVFDGMVVANNPDRIHMIHDIDAFIEEGTAPSLGGSELYTVDNKRQSMILVFELDGELMTAVAESLRTHGDLALYIDTRAVYSAEGFVDMTDGSPVLVPDILVVR